MSGDFHSGSVMNPSQQAQKTSVRPSGVMRRWQTAIGFLFALIILVSVMPKVRAQAPTTAAEAATELLQDGLDAMRDNDVALAKQLFLQLQKQYPGTAEAGRAGLALEDFSDDGSSRSSLKSPQVRSSQLDDLRRKFLLDVGDRVFFAENSDQIGVRSRVMIDQQARWIKSKKGIVVTLVGRADDGGSAADALALSGARAEAVRQRLLAAGISDDQIFIDARGDSDPLATCREAICKAQNRHTEALLGYAQQANDVAPR